jgi:drug/metabolite transporter (DMT)-like permease
VAEGVTATPVGVDARSHARAELGLLLVVLIWGANFAVIKWALLEIPPYAFSAIRFSCSALCLCALAWYQEGPPRFPPGTTRRLIWLGIAGNTVYQALFMIGLTHTSVGNVALLVGCSPVLVALLGWLTGLERLSRPVVWGIVIAFAGIALVVGVHGPEFSRRTLLGDLSVLLASLGWASYTLGVRTISGQVSTLWLTAATTLTGTPLLLLLGGPQLLELDWGGLSLRTWLALAYTILLSLVFAYHIWNVSIRLVGSARTAIFGAGVPVVGVLLAWPLLGERPRLVQLIGAALIVTGVLLARRREAPLEG